jgi:predicted transcriptional regulator
MMALVSDNDNTVSIRIPKDIRRGINEIAAKRGCSASDIMREALIIFVQTQTLQDTKTNGDKNNGNSNW